MRIASIFSHAAIAVLCLAAVSAEAGYGPAPGGTMAAQNANAVAITGGSVAANSLSVAGTAEDNPIVFQGGKAYTYDAKISTPNGASNMNIAPGGSLSFSPNGNRMAGVPSDGGFILTKLGAAPSNAPGTGTLRLFVIAGTNSGTCKLMAAVGTSSTAAVIADNIGTGC